MIQQQSYKENNRGQLYLIPTPIGNLEDMTFRAVKLLNEVDLILAEDTRHTIKLLNHFNIQTTMKSFHEYSPHSQIQKTVEMAKNGQTIALVSDAGMPLINDPGHPLVRAFLNEALSVIALPGANAALTALVASGMNTERFTYYGFFPRESKAQKEVVYWIGTRSETAIFYESPFRVKKTITVLSKSLNKQTQIVLARELTKQYEEFIRGTIEEVQTYLESRVLKGEYVLLVEGGQALDSVDDNEKVQAISLRDQVLQYIERYQVSVKEAIKQIAKRNQLKKQEVYQAYHEIE